MATLLDNTLYASNSTAIMFRAWTTFIYNAFLLGLVNTADTGQIDLTTVAAPSSPQQTMGYKIFRTNDALTPIYIKIEFGSGAAAGTPATWITIGTSTNGAGIINGTILLARTQITIASGEALTQQLCFASGASNRICYAMFLTVTSSPLWFSLERRKDSELNDADTGIIIDWGLATTAHKSLCAPFTGLIPTPEIGLQFILSSNNPAAYGNVIPEGLRIPCLGPSEPPGLNITLCSANDYGSFAQPTITINEADHTFKHCGPYITTLRGGSSGPYDINTRLLLRYE